VTCHTAAAMKNGKAHHGPHGFRNNYVGSVTKSLGEVLRWQWARIRNGLPPDPQAPIPQVTADLGFLLRNAAAGTAMVRTVTWIGHATTLVQAGGLNVLTDPAFSRRASPVQFAGPRRAQEPGIALRQLPHIDVVVISHNHYDHLDRNSIQALARQPGGSPLFLVPLGLKAWLARLGVGRALELDWWEHHDFAGVEFHFTPVQHWSGRSLRDRNKTLWGGWAVFAVDFHWYFSGDTGYSPDFVDTRQRFAERQTVQRGGGFDVALIAVGACEPRWFMQPQHVDPAEALQIHLDLGAKHSVGIHWGTFSLSDEPLDHPIKALAEARLARAVPPERFRLLAIGATCRLPARNAG
jgi:N-acyl-phosphatidylethanolamine-hydrolysing phospholipase D